MWEPRWQWNLNGLLCESCFTKKETDYKIKKNYCSICSNKLKFIRYNPKSKWSIDGQLCRTCWDKKNSEKRIEKK